MLFYFILSFRDTVLFKPLTYIFDTRVIFRLEPLFESPNKAHHLPMWFRIQHFLNLCMTLSLEMYSDSKNCSCNIRPFALFILQINIHDLHSITSYCLLSDICEATSSGNITKTILSPSCPFYLFVFLSLTHDLYEPPKLASLI